MDGKKWHLDWSVECDLVFIMVFPVAFIPSGRNPCMELKSKRKTKWENLLRIYWILPEDQRMPSLSSDQATLIESIKPFPSFQEHAVEVGLGTWTHCCCRGPSFSFQQPHSSSQPPVTPALGDPIPSFWTSWVFTHVCAWTHVRTHREN